MNLEPTLITPVFHVTDLPAALAYYNDVLSFAKEFEVGGHYAGVGRGKAQIHLSLAREGVTKPAGMGNAYVVLAGTAEVDAYYSEVVARGARVRHPLATQDYGMRDFSIEDLDGNWLTFGADLPEE